MCSLKVNRKCTSLREISRLVLHHFKRDQLLEQDLWHFTLLEPSDTIQAELSQTLCISATLVCILKQYTLYIDRFFPIDYLKKEKQIYFCVTFLWLGLITLNSRFFSSEEGCKLRSMSLQSWVWCVGSFLQ